MFRKRARASGEPERERDAERHGDARESAASLRLCTSVELRSGSCRTDRSGSPEYQRVDQPWAVERERPSLNENRIATRIGTIDQAR